MHRKERCMTKCHALIIRWISQNIKSHCLLGKREQKETLKGSEAPRLDFLQSGTSRNCQVVKSENTTEEELKQLSWLHRQRGRICSVTLGFNRQ